VTYISGGIMSFSLTEFAEAAGEDWFEPENKQI